MQTLHGIGSGWIGSAGTSRIPPFVRRSGWRFWLAWLVLVLAPVPAVAQGVGVTSLNVRQYLSGGTSPIAPPFNVPVSAVTCNQPVTSSTPHSVMWDDPVNAGMICLYIDPGTGPLFAKVFGVIDVTLTNLAGTLESPESNRASFPRPPLAPTSLKAIR